MSHYRAYPAYKDSGVEWLGKVPSHWEIAPLWSVYRPVKRTGFTKEPLLSVYRDYGVVLKASRDDNHNRASDDLDPYQLVEPGQLVTNKMKTWQGSIAVSELRGIVSPAYFVYEPIRNQQVQGSNPCAGS
jgi:type I restriction enzyme S subunit